MRCIIETQSWIRPQNDPYRLENFQQAYDNIVSGESKIVRASDEFAASARSVRKEFSATAKTQLKLKATHYALKIFQKRKRNNEALNWTSRSRSRIRLSIIRHYLMRRPRVLCFRNSGHSFARKMRRGVIL